MQKYTSPQAKCEQFSLGNTISAIRERQDIRDAIIYKNDI